MTTINLWVQLIFAWIYAKLEHITGTLSGLTVITLDIPNTILQIVMAFVLGGTGALGSYLVKYCIEKLSRKKRKK